MDINELTIGEVKAIADMIKGGTIGQEECLWKVGTPYLIRTVTMMLMGKLKAVTKQELLLEDASWIADSGRFSDALIKGIDKMPNSEIEPFNEDVIVGRGSIIDAVKYIHGLKVSQK